MSTSIGGSAGLALALVAGVLLGGAGVAVAGSLYSWRTDDGTYAFADDPKKIPPRYRDAAEERVAGKLEDYERFTESDPAARRDYERALVERLHALRALNASSSTVRTLRSTPSPNLSVRLGGANSPELDVARAGEAPIVIEDVRVRGRGDMATRHDTIVRQGDRTLVVLKGRRRAVSTLDTVDEDDLYR